MKTDLDCRKARNQPKNGLDEKCIRVPGKSRCLDNICTIKNIQIIHARVPKGQGHGWLMWILSQYLTHKKDVKLY